MKNEHFSRTTDLLSFLDLDIAQAPYAIAAEADPPLLVPRSFAERMRKADWFDPLLLQALPRSEEAVSRRGFVADPLGELPAEAAPGVLHKYHGRALLLASQSCSLRCRFCFRRNYPFRPMQRSLYDGMLDYCRRTTSLREVVLSGGDPLCCPPEELNFLLRELASLPHLATIRIHTRLPVADPGSLSPDKLESLSRMCREKTGVVVVHANHAAEIAHDCPAALENLRSTGAILLSQSVLLKSVNDSVAALADLSYALLDNGVTPYYLHQLDRAAGTWHFEVPAARGCAIMGEFRNMAPGYAVPRYVQEIAGEKAKRMMNYE